MYASAFPDVRLEVVAAYSQGETHIAELRAAGTHKGDLMGIRPTNRSMRIPICSVIELRDGKIWRECEYFDSGAMLSQLGVIESPLSAQKQMA